MTKRHTITIEDIEAFLSSHWFPFASSFDFVGKSNKRFEISMQGVYRVIDHEKIVYEGTDMHAAIEAYNDTP